MIAASSSIENKRNRTRDIETNSESRSTVGRRQFRQVTDGVVRWLRTGDIAIGDENGYIEVVDRAKDVIGSGGEWISSVELENALMAHEDAAEAVVIAAAHERWQERPVAFLVPKAGRELDVAGVRAFLTDEFPQWWLPADMRFHEGSPKNATGKFDKKTLRETVDGPELPYAPGEAE
jgi:fatty-acyl-CoA synthase